MHGPDNAASGGRNNLSIHRKLLAVKGTGLERSDVPGSDRPCAVGERSGAASPHPRHCGTLFQWDRHTWPRVCSRTRSHTPLRVPSGSATACNGKRAQPYPFQRVLVVVDIEIQANPFLVCVLVVCLDQTLCKRVLFFWRHSRLRLQRQRQ